VARRGDLTVAEVAADFDVSVESVRRWVRQADIDGGVKDGLTMAEQPDLVQLRRRAASWRWRTRPSAARLRTSRPIRLPK
jgi:transposase-like protein